MILVVDASIVAKWFVIEDHTDHAEALLDPPFDLHAPEFVLAEIGNVVWKKHQEGSITFAELRKSLDLFDSLDLTLHPVREIIGVAVNGAVETGQSVYDWAYLALAISLSCPLMTADRKFFRAMRATRFRQHLLWVEAIPGLIDAR